jgi:hypothetical protein
MLKLVLRSALRLKIAIIAACVIDFRRKHE